jgi:hypothetical protein
VAQVRLATRAPTRAAPAAINSACAERSYTVARGKGVSHDAPVAIRFLRFRLPQHDLGACKQRDECISCRHTARRRTGFLRQREWWHLDRGEVDLAAVIEHEGAAIDETAGVAARDGLSAARKRRLRPFLRRNA